MLANPDTVIGAASKTYLTFRGSRSMQLRWTVITILLSGCTITPKYSIHQAEYSSWRGGEEEKEHYTRSKTILLNAETGDTWHLEYNSQNKTRDGFGWKKLPRNDEE